MRKRMISLAELEAQFWALVRKCRHGRTCRRCCWLWTGKRPLSYGLWYDPVRCRMVQAHRMALELTHGAYLFPWNTRRRSGPVEWLVCLHLCDVRSCCNPLHLMIGTQGDNVRDMLRKGRGRRKDPVDA